MGLDGRPDEEGNILKKEGCGTCQMQTPDQRKMITELFRICQEYKKHYQVHNGPEHHRGYGELLAIQIIAIYDVFCQN